MATISINAHWSALLSSMSYKFSYWSSRWFSAFAWPHCTDRFCFRDPEPFRFFWVSLISYISVHTDLIFFPSLILLLIWMGYRAICLGYWTELYINTMEISEAVWTVLHFIRLERNSKSETIKFSVATRLTSPSTIKDNGWRLCGSRKSLSWPIG